MKPAKSRTQLDRINLVQAFAEYDTSLSDPTVFVHTPALTAASSWANSNCFFVGRRGTGKTTIARYVEGAHSKAILIRPELFSPSTSALPVESFYDAKQKPFRSLTAAFRRSLQAEVLFARIRADADRGTRRLNVDLSTEWDKYSDLDFDLRCVDYIDHLLEPLAAKDDARWLEEVKVAKVLSRAMDSMPEASHVRQTILIDAIDDSWDGSQLAVIYLTALMHAVLEVNTQTTGIRALTFIRENVFDRVREIDSEFARLETCVVGLDWTQNQLLEMVERRFNSSVTSKVALGGPTWDKFVEGGSESRKQVFDFCQRRPRDVVTYMRQALDLAQSARHQMIMLADLQAAQRQFSMSRLRDLGDEYQENYPQIALVLSRFYGLARRWTIRGLAGFLQRLLLDSQITQACKSWIWSVCDEQSFAQLLYSIGFLGHSQPARRGKRSQAPISRATIFRSLGPSDSTPPPIKASTDLVIHPSYWDALDLQDVLIQDFTEDSTFGVRGIQFELPESLEFEVYQEELRELLETIKGIERGKDHARKFEQCVGDVLRLCFFRPLANVEEQVRDVDGVVRRDWVAANRSSTGFWAMVRHRYDATQVVFECKNYDDLSASDFQQSSYYMNSAGGKFVVVIFRGEVKNHYYDHIKRVANGQDGLILLLNDRDLQVFVRQAINGKVKDDHIQDRFDRTVRMIS